MNRPFREIDESTYAGRFAARLRTLRTDAKLSGVELAKLITQNGYSISYRGYMDWENGTSSPPIVALPSIATSFDISVRKLMPEK